MCFQNKKKVHNDSMAAILNFLRNLLYLKDYSLDLFDIWHEVRPISGNDASHFGILKKSKMAAVRQFFVFPCTLYMNYESTISWILFKPSFPY